MVVLYSLFGFFLAPWLLRNNAIESVRESLDAELRLGKVAVNPFVLSLRIDDLQLDDPRGLPIARIDQVFLNFQLSSVFRRAFTFDEFRVDAPELFIARDDGGALNIAFLTASADGGNAETAIDQDSAMIRLLIFDFAVNESVLNWSDQTPVDPVEARFGPVNISIADLNTLPNQAGQQEVTITTETEGTLSWSGNLQLNPLQSAGHASIKGSHFPLLSAYVRHEIGFDFVDGIADVELDYRVTSGPDGEIEASIDNFELQFSDVLVRTFSAAAASTEADREVLRLPLAKLSGGAIRWPVREVSISSLTFADGLVSAYRDEAGAINLVPGNMPAADPAGTAVDPQESSTATAPADAWRVSLDRLTIRHLALRLEDHSVQPFADIGVESLDLELSGISNEPGARFPAMISLLAGSGGTLTLEGDLTVLPSTIVDADLQLENFPLAWTQPYIKPLADVNFDSGTMNFEGRLRSSAEDALQLDGDLAIAGFLITETDQGSRLGSWERFSAEKLSLSVSRNQLHISELRFDRPYADILIAADGSVNLGRIEKGDATDRPEVDVVAADTAADDGAASAHMAISIGRVIVANAAADFEDRSLPLPFVANIAELNGDITAIATMSVEPSEVSLEGKVDEFGLVRVTGIVTPLDVSLNTDLKVAFQNVEMPKFSAYTIPFAGRKIASGKLDVDLGYKVTASELQGENKIVLRDFELGEKVEHPGAMSLPLGLAVALLKDAEGKIDIDLPVRGNVDDPEFSYGRVVLKALGNLIVKVVASPFALLGRLVGVEASDLEYISFIAGRADLTPPEMEKAQKLAEALALRPELRLDIQGVVDRDLDGLAIRTQQLDHLIEERIAVLAADDRDDAMYAEQRRRVLESLFNESGNDPDAKAVLEALRARFTLPVTANEAGGPGNRFDVLAYSSELRRQLIERRPLAEQELAGLATARAANVLAAVLEADDALAARVILGQLQAVEASEDEGIRMKVSISAAAND